MDRRPSPALMFLVVAVYIALVVILVGNAAIVIPGAIAGLIGGALIGYRNRRRPSR